MEVKDSINIIVAKEKNTYRFEIPAGATFGEAIDACFECLDALQDMQRKTVEKAKAGKEANVKEAGE